MGATRRRIDSDAVCSVGSCLQMNQPMFVRTSHSRGHATTRRGPDFLRSLHFSLGCLECCAGSSVSPVKSRGNLFAEVSPPPDGAGRYRRLASCMEWLFPDIHALSMDMDRLFLIRYWWFLSPKPLRMGFVH